MVVQHNLTASNASRMLNITNTSLGSTQEELSSGYKINRSSDDAAGLAISEKMRKQIKGINQSSTNSGDGISLVQIADGAMHEIHDMLQRVNELSIQAANGTMSLLDREACQEEVDQIKDEIDRIQSGTYFNKIPVLKGAAITMEGGLISVAMTETVVKGDDLPGWLTSGIDSGSLSQGRMADTYNTTVKCTYKDGGVDKTQNVTIPHPATYIDFSNFNASNLNELDGKGFYSTCCSCLDRYSIRFDASSATNTKQVTGKHYVYTVGISGATSAADIIDRIMEATKDPSGELGNPNNHYTKYARQGDKLVIYDDRSSADEKDIIASLGASGAVTDVKYEKYNPSTNTGWEHQTFGEKSSNTMGAFGLGYSETIHTPAQYNSSRITRTTDLDIQSGAEADMDNKVEITLPCVNCEIMGIRTIDFTVPNGPESAIDAVTIALRYVGGERARMGAYQNRLEHTIRNLDNVAENTTAAESRIRDTDMADAMVRFSKDNILAQAGQAMLAQANTDHKSVLNLLQ